MDTNTAFIKLQPINELQEVTTLEPGNFLFEDGDGNLKRMTTDNFYQIINNFAKPIAPADVPPVTANRWYKPTTSSTDPGTNYPNAGNLKARKGYDTLFYYDGTNWIKTEVELPGITASVVFNPSDNVNTSVMSATASYVDFKPIYFYQNIDLSQPNESPYTELIGATKFTLKAGAKTGKLAVYKLTGGTVTFDTNFVKIPNSDNYDATKTNIIYFWYEYGNVRYFIENQTLEAVSYTKVVSYYNLNGKTPNTLLSAITPNYGAAFTGNTGGYRINASGIWAATTANAGSTSAAIAINLGSVVNYRATLYLSVATLAEINIGATAYNTWTNFIDINFAATSTIKHIYPGSPVGGQLLVSTSAITFPQASVYRWDFEVVGSLVKVYFEGVYLCQYTNANTGNLFAIILSKAGDVLQSIKIEEL
ncbi:hypothetical protein [Chryseobacterium daeguense]|uniref:hypothetical protein n=1 Tax=Chryseobacterium daeguense TaxID=412438 RepID=UPI0004895871|nr:hypothetical protein [Chryseobacterium daeguense]